MKTPRIAGFSLTELLVTVAVLGLVGSGLSYLIGGIPSSSKLVKLENDVATINQAIAVYRTFGGSMESATTPEEVIARLKTRSKSGHQVPGLSGSMVDPRIAVVMQTPAEAGSDEPRAVYDPAKKHFAILNSGALGVKYFKMDESLAGAPVVEETRSTAMKLANRDNWIWDYSDRAMSDVVSGPTPIGTTTPTPTGGTPVPTTPPSPPVPDPTPHAGSKTLRTPIFSIPSGDYPITKFTLSLKLRNPNPSGISRVVYAIGDGGWRVYDGTAIAVSPEATVTAYAESIDAKWSNSDYGRERYKATPVELDVPGIALSASRFDYDEDKIIEVILSNPNNPDVSALEYRVSGTRWETYTGTFRLHVDDNPIGAVIEARSVATAPYYLDSDVAYTNIDRPAPWFSISGSSDGVFGHPIGGSDMRTNLSFGQTSEFFTWGVASRTADPSSLFYTGADFFDVTPGERFLVGTLDYYNGTIRSGSGADAVNLAVDLTFDGSPTITFDFDLELINTRNNTGTRAGDADFVLLGNVASEAPTTIFGNDYKLILEFGETTGNGFSSIDQFHVYENAGATGSIYGRLELVD